MIKEMELYSYINPISANPTKQSNTCKTFFIFTVCESLHSQNFQKKIMRKNKYMRNNFLLVKINSLEN